MGEPLIPLMLPLTILRFGPLRYLMSLTMMRLAPVSITKRMLSVSATKQKGADRWWTVEVEVELGVTPHGRTELAACETIVLL